ncbi:hypothetical protein AVEN_172315-1 [Araneus ventricosus]|uniref:Uncharacterized protein n=1 Tax=Araneus ventricosus TaxID=182803 RepID=A0A4Y2E579_ARAVE|nr:hypothetical protein AVEN_172315-1 [Araneus ventricosus]
MNHVLVVKGKCGIICSSIRLGAPRTKRRQASVMREADKRGRSSSFSDVSLMTQSVTLRCAINLRNQIKAIPRLFGEVVQNGATPPRLFNEVFEEAGRNEPPTPCLSGSRHSP